MFYLKTVRFLLPKFYIPRLKYVKRFLQLSKVLISVKRLRLIIQTELEIIHRKVTLQKLGQSKLFNVIQDKERK